MMFLSYFGFKTLHMGRMSTYPTLYEERTKLDVFKLRKDGVISQGYITGGSIEWSRRGEVFSSISYRCDMSKGKSQIKLSYIFKSEEREYIIQIVSVPSNLGKGEIYYFLCPETGKKCRFLYSIGGWFLHRKAFQQVYYEKQTYSKAMRDADRFFRSFNLADKARQEINSKYFKKFYAGKPTKRYKKLMDQIKYNAQYTSEDFRRMLGK